LSSTQILENVPYAVSYSRLQNHASECDGILSAPPSPSTPSSATPLGTCPLCGDSMEPHLLPTHASSCGSEPSPRAFSKAGTLRPAFRECPVCDRMPGVGFEWRKWTSCECYGQSE